MSYCCSFWNARIEYAEANCYLVSRFVPNSFTVCRLSNKDHPQQYMVDQNKSFLNGLDWFVVINPKAGALRTLHCLNSKTHKSQQMCTWLKQNRK